MTEGVAGLGRRIRVARESKGIGIKEVAALTGLTSSLISQFERGLTGISLTSLQLIVNALDLKIASLFVEVDLQVVRHRDRQQVMRPGSTVPLSMASPDTFPIRVLECRLKPGQATSRTPAGHPGHECTVVSAGNVRLEVAGKQVDLHTGDSVTLDSGQPHLYTNVGADEAVLDVRG